MSRGRYNANCKRADMRYKFQIENGSIYDGSLEIVIKDYVAEIENITPATQLVINAHGGQLMTEKKSKSKKPSKSKDETLEKTKELLSKIKEVADGSTSP